MTEPRPSATETVGRPDDTAEHGLSVLDAQVMHRLASHVRQQDMDVIAGDEPLQQLIRALLGSFLASPDDRADDATRTPVHAPEAPRPEGGADAR